MATRRATSNIKTFLILAGTLAAFEGCGPGTSGMRPSDDFQERYLKVPDTVLVSTSPDDGSPAKAYPFQADIHFDASNKVITAQVLVKTSQGSVDTIDLAGQLRDDGTATLTDLQNQDRITGESYCVDQPKCQSIILNVSYKVHGVIKHKQFTSTSLETPPPDSPSSPAAVPDGVENPEATGIPGNELGEYVGPAPNHAAIQKLRSEVDSDPPGAPATLSPTPSPTPTSTATPSAAATPRPAPATLPHASATPAATPSLPARPMPTATPRSAPATLPSTPAPSPTPVRANAPATIPKPAPTPNVPEAPAKDDDAGELLQLEQSLAPLMDVQSDGGIATGCYAPAIVTGTPGRGCSGGKLTNGTGFSASGSGYSMLWPTNGITFGTSMMVSLLENTAAKFTTELYPGFSFVIGNVAKKTGGSIPGQSSHQNGLDVDIYYFGLKKPGYDTAVPSPGKVSPDLDFEKNWQFFRLVETQAIVQSDDKRTVLNRIFVNPAIKKAFCSWATEQNLLNDPINVDILRRMRPTPSIPGSHEDTGHEKHFHMRLQCSPHYPACRNQVDPPAGTGC